MWNTQANIYIDEEAKQKDPVIGDFLERVMNKWVHAYLCNIPALIVNHNSS